MFNQERRRTRDLLLEYDNSLIPQRLPATGISSIYPWTNISNDVLNNQIYALAASSGYVGTRQEFMQNFGSYLQKKEVMFAEYNDFPQVGHTDMLYFDLNDKILYYWDNAYIPVNAMVIEDTILNGGEA